MGYGHGGAQKPDDWGSGVEEGVCISKQEVKEGFQWGRQEKVYKYVPMLNPNDYTLIFNLLLSKYLLGSVSLVSSAGRGIPGYSVQYRSMPSNG